MTKDDIRQTIYTGNLIQCDRDEYDDIRRYLLEIAGEFINDGDPVRNMIALNEVRRLDREFNYRLPI